MVHFENQMSELNYSIYINQITVKNLWIEYPKYKIVTNSIKWWFKQKYKKFLYHNKDMNSLLSMTGKTVKYTR